MTAEAALVLPVLAAVTVALVWMLGLATTQMRVTDAAREAARAVARGDTAVSAEALAHTAAPGAEVAIERVGERVRVRVVSVVQAPGDLLGDLGSVQLAASAETRVEGAGP